MVHFRDAALRTPCISWNYGSCPRIFRVFSKFLFVRRSPCDYLVQMNLTDAERMESSLIAGAEAGIELRFILFRKFFAIWPDRQADFLNLDAASRRMTDETLEMLIGLAKGEEQWVWPLVAELAFTHRSYGQLPWAEYESWIELTIETVGEAAGAAWSLETEAAWTRQAERLKTLILEARTGWDEVMPGHVAGRLSPR